MIKVRDSVTKIHEAEHEGGYVAAGAILPKTCRISPMLSVGNPKQGGAQKNAQTSNDDVKCL